MKRLSKRDQAEAISQFGDDLLKLIKPFCDGFSTEITERVCEVPHQDHLELIAEAFQRLGETISAECDEAEEADDRRRGNPLERDYRRYGA